MHIGRYLELSTAHVSEDTELWLYEQGKLALDNNEQQAYVAKTPFGYFVYVEEVPETLARLGYPADLIRCMEFASTQAVQYILFDRDAITISRLPVVQSESEG